VPRTMPTATIRSIGSSVSSDAEPLVARHAERFTDPRHLAECEQFGIEGIVSSARMRRIARAGATGSR